MKKAGMLSPSTDVQALAERAFAHLDGVTDEWLKSVQVEKVPGGQAPKGPIAKAKFLQMARNQANDPFCSGCLFVPAR
jgi:NitT/TauT family transport system substrate-binding protein